MAATRTYLSAMVGAVVIARALPDGQAAEQILASTTEGAQNLSRTKAIESD